MREHTLAHRLPAEASRRLPGAAPLRVPALAAPVGLACLAALAAGSAMQQSMELAIAPWHLVAATVVSTLVAAVVGARGGADWMAIPVGLGTALWLGRLAFFPGGEESGLGWLLRWWSALGPSFRGHATHGLPVNVGPVTLALFLHALGAALLTLRAVRGEPAPALLLGGGALLGLEIAYLTHAISRQVLLFFISGLALQTLGVWSGRHRRWRKEGVVFPPRAIGWWIARAGAVAAVAVALAWWLPASGPTTFVRDDRLRFLDGYVADLLIGPDPRGRTPVESPLGSSRLPQAGAIAGYGWSDGELGGPFRKSGRLLMWMRSERPVYLRGEAKEIYTGRGWLSASPAPADPLPPVRAPAQAGADEPLRFDLAARLPQSTAEGARDLDLEIRYGDGFQPWPPVVFAPWPTRALALPDAAPLRLGLRVDPQTGNIYAPLRRGQPLSLEYRATASVPPLDVEALKRAGVPESGMERFLQLPDALPQRVRELAREIAGGKATPYERAAALEAWLRQMPYVEDMPAPPPGADFVDDFLFNQKRGYCVYFSSAMVVMARSLGLPARWVKGFTAGEFDEEGLQYRITDDHAHAWVEVYFDRHGWVPFDPTPGFSYPREVLSPDPAPPGAPEETPAAAESTAPAVEPADVRPAAGLLLLAALAAVAWWTGRPRRQNAAGANGEGDLADVATVAARVRAWFRRVEGRLARAGLGRRRHETPTEFQTRVAGAMPELGPALGRVVGLYLRARYGRVDLRPDDAETVAAAGREIEQFLG